MENECIKQVKENEIIDFYKETYKRDNKTPTKTMSIEAELISSGWFVKEMFTANKQLTGHAFIFSEHKVFYVPSTLEEYISEQKRNEYEQSYVNFLVSKFGNKYQSKHIQYEIETKIKEEKEREELEKTKKFKESFNLKHNMNYRK